MEEHINKNLVPPGVTAADRSAVTADLLDAEELAQLRSLLHASPDTKLLFVYHDGAVLEKRQTQDLARLAP